MLYILFISLINFSGLFCWLLCEHSLENFTLNTNGQSGQDTTPGPSDTGKSQGGSDPGKSPGPPEPDKTHGPSEPGKSHDDSEEGNSQGGDNKPRRKTKPNLFLDLSKTDAEKDTEKVGLCDHDHHTTFISQTDRDVESVYCDFNQDQEGGHRAFDSKADIAFLCKNCHAVACKDCINEYPEEDGY